jgi:tRNA threonylcarbamoyladenosine biosynthesis protein TsaE
MYSIELLTLKNTEFLGTVLGKIAEPGDVITLAGSLGAGKTALTQAIGRGLEVDPRIYITSPTFSLLHEYKGRIPLYHLDLYRLGSEEEIESLGFSEYFYASGLTVIEWPERLGTLMPEKRLHIELVISVNLSYPEKFPEPLIYTPMENFGKKKWPIWSPWCK